ncbi:Sensor histidine kinase YpdA [Caloramator mitchellensis]|uniref:histidine kinase n=1 Tax=Caloramator mitchellensis TaxID=908809 RepID=A0A0R3JUA5_CALMK|nr:LytS/YhcK type 5TM receptor domain-containing protein [Caloramator mitchellensis]KRQ87158.1 Sensor histidine kinase YpdA [Caloramator mitchellensis]
MLFLTLFERMSIVALVAYMFTHTPLFKKIYKRRFDVSDKLILIIFFSAFSILGTYLGIRMEGGAIANIRPIGAIVAGYIGGPLVGSAVGLIAGGHRYLLGGYTALACGISTIMEGLTGAFFRSKKGDLSPFVGFISGVIAEFIQMGIILLVSKPYSQALELEREIAFPMIIINSFGVAIFIDIIKNVIKQYNEIGASYALKSLNIAKQTSVYLRKGLDENTAQNVAEIIQKTGEFKGVIIGNRKKVLKYLGEKIDEQILYEDFIEYLQNPAEKIISAKKTKKEQYFYTIPLYTNSELEGFLGIEVDTLDEIDRHFMDFIRELAELLSVQLEIHKLNKKAEMAVVSELKALRAQIHPHFLFNALNTIASFCRINPMKAKDLILDLSNYFRGTLKTEEFVPLSKEIELIEAYLNIEKARFGDRINIEYRIDDSILDYYIPHFILQPIVENAIKHGLTTKSDGGEIIIKVCEIGDRLNFEVSDSGVGIDEIKLKRLMKENKGIGLSNVRERIKLIYGNSSKFEIISEYGKGTIVSFTIPKEVQHEQYTMHNS